MKPAAFEYHAPTTVQALLDLLVAHGDAGKILAGGQSLVPVMNFRLARPAQLFDINGIRELEYLRAEAGSLRIGALTRHAAFHKPAAPGPTGKLLSEVVRHIAHLPIRTRGTFCGSIAHADPASEWCVVARALEADIVVRSARGERVIPVREYFHGTFATALAEAEVITEVRLPLLDDSWRTGFYEFSRRAGDFALAMTVVALKLERGKLREARIGIGGVEDRPSRCKPAEDILVRGGTPEAAAQAVSAAVEPLEDLHADAPYRKDLVRTTTQRALEQALQRA
jgi:aerobic carbon-monoxide dehydrogenase medium subunit